MKLKYETSLSRRLNNGSYYSNRRKKKIKVFAGVRLINIDYWFCQTLGKWMERDKCEGWRSNMDGININSHKAFKRYVKKHSKYLPSGTIMELMCLVYNSNVYIKTK